MTTGGVTRRRTVSRIDHRSSRRTGQQNMCSPPPPPTPLSPSSSRSPITAAILKLISRRGHVTYIRAFPRHGSDTSFIIRCRVADMHASRLTKEFRQSCPVTVSHSQPTTGRNNRLGGPASAGKTKHCTLPKTKTKTSHYSRPCERTRHHQMRSQCCRRFRLKLVTTFLRYHRRESENREQGKTDSTVGSSGSQGDEDEEVGGSEGASLSPNLCGDDGVRVWKREGESDHSAALRRSPSVTDKIFVSHSEEDFEKALILVRFLEHRKLPCILPERDYRSGSIVSSTANALESSRRIILLLTRNYVHTKWCVFELQLSVWEMYHRERALLIPVIVDLPESEVPPCLRNLTHVNMGNDPGYLEQLIFFLKGRDIPVAELMPVGNVSHGLAWGYYYYLKIILPGLKQRIDDWCRGDHCVDVHMPRKLYILVPASCHCPAKLTYAGDRIQFCGNLDRLRRDSAGTVNRSYVQCVWNLQRKDGQVVQFVSEYAAVVDTLYKMESQGSAGLCSQLKGRERDNFVRVLNGLLKADGLNLFAELVTFEDTDGKGNVLPLSDILEPCVEKGRSCTPPPQSLTQPHRPLHCAPSPPPLLSLPPSLSADVTP
ncbi:stimulator of interferon genes protein-like [Babylonia areolata]|uniref:stimulator of interferon genes protein-like n=1 Tax=Babylonia areolata TaxID=304850 RepID=UPI003FD5F476